MLAFETEHTLHYLEHCAVHHLQKCMYPMTGACAATRVFLVQRDWQGCICRPGKHLKCLSTTVQSTAVVACAVAHVVCLPTTANASFAHTTV